MEPKPGMKLTLTASGNSASSLSAKRPQRLTCRPRLRCAEGTDGLFAARSAQSHIWQGRLQDGCCRSAFVGLRPFAPRPAIRARGKVCPKAVLERIECVQKCLCNRRAASYSPDESHEFLNSEGGSPDGRL